MNMQEFLSRNPETLSAVMNDKISFHPEKTRNTYSHWLNNIKDWCISRQLWWGQQIPAWYDEAGNVYVAATEEEAQQQAMSYEQRVTGENSSLATHSSKLSLRQDEDCLDTWFSSWLWPMEVFKGISNPGNKDIEYYYPTTTLVTGQDIIFFWVARMIMAGYEYKKEIPFKDVYFTGMVRDKLGRKMSKQLGNSPDLLEMIEKDGADAVRFGIMITSPAGNDLMWDPSGNEQGRFFINKMWNALKLVKMWEGRQADITAGSETKTESHFAIDWFDNRLKEVRLQLDEQFADFRLSESLKTIYSLIWDDFCSWYLEWVKPSYTKASEDQPGQPEPISPYVYEKTVGFFEELMQILHPFMPFITEEIFHQLRERNDDLTVKQNPASNQPEKRILESAALLKEVISTIRDARVKAQLKPRETIKLHIQSENPDVYEPILSILSRQVNAVSTTFTSDPVAGCITLVVQKDKFYLETTTVMDSGAQKIQLQKDLDYLKGFLVSVDKKLSNERFVQNAKPEVIEIERKKKADAEEKIKVIEESLASLG